MAVWDAGRCGEVDTLHTQGWYGVVIAIFVQCVHTSQK